MASTTTTHAVHQEIDTLRGKLDDMIATGKDGEVTLSESQLDEVRNCRAKLQEAQGTLVCVQIFSVYST